MAHKLVRSEQRIQLCVTSFRWSQLIDLPDATLTSHKICIPTSHIVRKKTEKCETTSAQTHSLNEY